MKFTCVAVAIVCAVLVQAAPIPINFGEQLDAQARARNLAPKITARDGILPVVAKSTPIEHHEEQLIARYNPIEGGKAAAQSSSINDIVEHAIEEVQPPQLSPAHGSSQSSQSSDISSSDSSTASSPKISLPTPMHHGRLPNVVDANSGRGSDDARHRPAIEYRVILPPTEAEMEAYRAATEVPPQYYDTFPGPGHMMNGWEQHPLPSSSNNAAGYRNTKAENLQWHRAETSDHQLNLWRHAIDVRGEAIRLSQSRKQHLSHLAFVAKTAKRERDASDKYNRAYDNPLRGHKRAKKKYFEAIDAHEAAEQWAHDNWPQEPGPVHPPNRPDYQLPERAADADPNDPAPGRAYPGIPAIGVPLVGVEPPKLGPIGVPFHRDAPVIGMPADPEFAVHGEPTGERVPKKWKRLTRAFTHQADVAGSNQASTSNAARESAPPDYDSSPRSDSSWVLPPDR